MDPLSDVLSLLKVDSYWSAGLDFGGAWSLEFGPYDGIKFYAAVSGGCWLSVDGVPDVVRASAGDCVLLPRGRPFRVASDLSLPAIDPTKSLTGVKDGGVTTYNGGGDFFCVGGQFVLTGDASNLLLGVLPPIVHIRDEADKAVLHWCIDRMRQELREPQPGGFVVAKQLATLLLVQTLRLQLAEGKNGGVGWLFALADKQMAAALAAMHGNPGAAWTVQSLAEHAGMSRTTFTLKFKETVGASPMEYLTRWRMTLAGDRLLSSRAPISEIAREVGYDSQSAFSFAFKRIMNCSPRQYGRMSSVARRQEAALGNRPQTSNGNS